MVVKSEQGMKKTNTTYNIILVSECDVFCTITYYQLRRGTDMSAKRKADGL